MSFRSSLGVTLPDSKKQKIDTFWSKCKNLTDENVSPDRSSLEQLSPVALAHIGDAVYELYVRNKLLMPPRRIADYHAQVVTQVRAETQATYLQHLEPHLTDEEKDILRRGRNAVTHKPRRLSAKIYQQASSLETLIGYLYLTNCDRLKYLFTKINITSSVNGI